ncbi:MAG TPA: polya polymerase [Clostridiales bacterium]|nr:polya polymerase [Clostridiales bacterium]
MTVDQQRSIIDEFTELINGCQGQVAFVTPEGDRLVANSMLSALVGFSAILSFARKLDLRLDCESPADCERIRKFLQKYNLGQFSRDPGDSK